MGFGNNPIVFLTKRMWEFSKGNRKSVILFSILFVIANIIAALDPLILATLLNIVQEQGVTQENIFLLIGLIALFPLLSLVFWALHGPARVLVEVNANVNGMFLGFGDVTVSVGGSAGKELLFKEIPHYLKVKNLIEESKIAQERGLRRRVVRRR
tara:strand:- start:26788 stop:27252 length:465 start_codon:yes stop_codon:yes gene_type:complete